MKNLFLSLAIIAFTVCGLMLAMVVSQYFDKGVDKRLVYFTLGSFGSLLAGINLIYKYKHINR